MAGTSLHELMELGGWKYNEMVLRYALILLRLLERLIMHASDLASAGYTSINVYIYVYISLNCLI